MAPENKEEFDEFEKAIAKKVQSLSSSSNYPDFIEQLIKDLCIDRKCYSIVGIAIPPFSI